ncbi:MAG: hypothetical protein PHX83_08615 [Acidobacteriia bacterium]|nr:hypothetical protein [Terriglobia bacterium]
MKEPMNRTAEWEARWQKEIMFWILACLIALGLIMAGTEAIRADVSLGAFPIRSEHQVAAGQTKTDGITVENESAEPVHMRVTVADWYLTPGGDPMFVKRGRVPQFSMSDWIEVNPAEFDLGPHSQQIIRYTFTVPMGTPDGGYRTAILIESVPNITQPHDIHMAYLNARIGAIIYDRVGAPATQASVTAQQVILDPNNPSRLGVQITLKNSGNSYFRFKGECKIVDGQGTEVETLPINDAVVLPQSERTIFLPLKKDLPAQKFSIVSSLDVGLKELLESVTQVQP